MPHRVTKRKNTEALESVAKKAKLNDEAEFAYLKRLPVDVFSQVILPFLRPADCSSMATTSREMRDTVRQAPMWRDYAQKMGMPIRSAPLGWNTSRALVRMRHDPATEYYLNTPGILACEIDPNHPGQLIVLGGAQKSFGIDLNQPTAKPKKLFKLAPNCDSMASISPTQPGVIAAPVWNTKNWDVVFWNLQQRSRKPYAVLTTAQERYFNLQFHPNSPGLFGIRNSSSLAVHRITEDGIETLRTLDWPCPDPQNTFLNIEQSPGFEFDPRQPSRLMIWDHTGKLFSWNWQETGAQPAALPGTLGETRATHALLDPHNDHRMITRSRANNELTLWNIDTGEALLHFASLGDSSSQFEFHPHAPNKFIIVPSYSKELLIWDLSGEQACSQTISGHEHTIHGVTFDAAHPNHVISWDSGSIVRFWDMAVPTPRKVSERNLYHNELSRDPNHAQRFFSISENQLHVIDSSLEAAAAPVIFSSEPGASNIEGHISDPGNANRWLTWNEDFEVSVWDFSQDEPKIYWFIGPRTPISSCAFNPHHPHLVIAIDRSGLLYEWDLRHPTRRPRETHIGNMTSPQCLYHPLYPDTLLIWSDRERVPFSVWDTSIWPPTAHQHAIPSGHSIEKCLIDPNFPNSIVTYSADNGIFIWHFNEQKELNLTKRLKGSTAILNGCLIDTTTPNSLFAWYNDGQFAQWTYGPKKKARIIYHFHLGCPITACQRDANDPRVFYLTTRNGTFVTTLGYGNPRFLPGEFIERDPEDPMTIRTLVNENSVVEWRGEE